MTQAKGILPIKEDAAMRSPNAEGYFIYGSLDPSLTRDALIEFLTNAKAALDELVRKDSSGTDIADVVVAFSPRLLGTPSTPRFSSQVPNGFAEPVAMPGPIIECDLLFYIASMEEERVANFVRALWNLRPPITEIAMDRGYQRKDGTEVFGYADGLRNVEKSRRSSIIFVHEDRHPEEASGVVDGSYMAFIRIEQHPQPFQALEPAVRDGAMGRTQDGTRLDLPSGSDPRKEPAMPAGEPPSVTSHVRKVGPRGPHDDVEIFRRGLPFMELEGGQMRIGLNFVSFQASPDQFDVVLNDWMMNPNFPTPGAGVDRLFDPALGITTILKSGFFYVPPHDDRFLGASLFDAPKGKGKVKTGQVSVRKRVVDASGVMVRVERGGFQFQLLDSSGSVVSEFATDSKGHAQSDELPVGTYTLHEVPPDPARQIQPAPDQTIELKSKHEVVQVRNTVTQPNPPYGSQ